MIRRSPPRACVVVPARNEADVIGAAIAALAAQVGVDPAAYTVVVLTNNCDDDTAERARRAGRQHPHLDLTVLERAFASHEATVGTARRVAMDEAADRLPRDGVIASTDGDTVVRPDWLAETLRAVEQGAELVGGRILACETPGDPELRRLYLADTAFRFLKTEVEALIDPTPTDPWPRHFQHFGASLAVTRAAYERVGGLPRVPHLEDVALHDRLRREDAAIRHSLAVRATTSTRLTGRVGVGLSTQLCEWRDLLRQGGTPTVMSADLVIARARQRRRLRERWMAERRLRSGETLGAFVDREMAAFHPPVQRLEPLGEAIASLRAGLVGLRRAGRAPLLSHALEQVEPVRLLAPAIEVAERSA